VNEVRKRAVAFPRYAELNDARLETGQLEQGSGCSM